MSAEEPLAFSSMVEGMRRALGNRISESQHRRFEELGVPMWVCQAARLVFKSSAPLSFLETALCVVAVMMGAWLSCLALCWAWKKAK